MLTRRCFLQTATLAAAAPAGQPKRIAIVATCIAYLSHASTWATASSSATLMPAPGTSPT